VTCNSTHRSIAMPPKVIAKNNDRGVLPVSAAARAAPARTPAPRLKLEIRRLPPGLTQTEFEEALGEEWKLHHGKVDWNEYRAGKVKAPGKMPEQSRCYLHVVNEGCVKELEQRFNSVVFHDKAGTHKIPEIQHLTPELQLALNQRTPLNVKQRTDTRQGTIDQDVDYQDFLEAETRPIMKPSAMDGDKAEKVEVKSTPLIDDLREKKANKAKAAATKAERKKEDDSKTHSRSQSKDAVTDRSVKGGQAAKVEQAAKDAAKVLTKQAAGKSASQPAPQPQAHAKAALPARSKKPPPSPKQQNALPARPTTPASSGPTSPAPNRVPPGQRRNADGIRKMLQKDLGIRPKSAGGAQAAASQPTPQPAAPVIKPTQSKAPTAPTQPRQPPTAPKATTAPKPAPTDVSATKAYLKHANPSQGMSEMLILRSLSDYGEVSNVTIDPRKGTAIAVFKDNEGLKKAMEAKRVPVANGAVEVLEFREAAPRPGGGGSGRGRGGFRGGRGGGRGGASASAQSALASATSASAASSTPPAPTASTAKAAD